MHEGAPASKSGRPEDAPHGSDVPAMPRYFPALDGLRFFSFLSVVVCHSFAHENLHDPTHPLAWLVPRFAELGRAGVDVFFTLSGFLITNILLSERRRTGSIDLKAFYVRRSLRILPIYYVALGVATLGILILGARYTRPFGAEVTPRLTHVLLPMYALFIGNYFSGLLPSTIVPFWTLCIEEQFYVLFPSSFAFVRGASPALWPIGVYFGLSIPARIALFLAPGAATHGIAFDLMACADNLLAGALLAQLAQAFPERVCRVVDRAGAFGEALALVLVLACVTVPRQTPVGSLAQTLTYAFEPWVVMFFLAMIAFGNGSIGRFLSRERLRSLGQLTYAGYVFHQYGIVIGFAITLRLEIDPFLQGALRVVIGTAIALGIAYVSKHTIEDRVLRLKQRFQERAQA